MTDLISEGDVNTTDERRRWQERNLNNTTNELLAEDADVFLHQSLSTPCLDVVTGCEGIYLYTQSGRKLIDFHGNSVHQVGYGNPRVIAAIKDQLDTCAFAPRRFTNLPAIKLAQKLTELAPGDLNRVLLAPGGTSVIGMALKLARAATGRFKTISMWDSFHGASLDAISLGGEATFRKDAGPLLPGCEHVPPPNPSHCVFGCGGSCVLRCADYVEYVLEKEGDVAAVVAETVRSIPYIPSKEYWQRVRAACDRHGALLILDEIPSGLGRTGHMFACEYYGIVPDILCIGKGLGGGIFPIAAMIAREGLNKYMADKACGHYTHEKSPVGCAAALATLGEIEERHLLQHVRDLGEYTLRRLSELRSQFAIITDVRGLGLQLGVELGAPHLSRGEVAQIAERILYSCLDRGLSFKISMGNVLTFYPPLVISFAEMDAALEILSSAFSDVLHVSNAK